MDIDILKGDISHEVDPHHHHSCHPEEEDIKTGYKGSGRVKGLDLGGGVWPA